MQEKNIELFPCIRKANNSTSPNVLHSISEYTFKVENLSGCGKHVHDNYLELFVVLEGEILSIVNKNEQLAKTGFFCLMTQGTEHHFMPSCNTKARIINLTCFFQTAVRLAATFFDFNLQNNSYFFTYLNDKQMDLVNSYISLLLSVNGSNNDELISSFVFTLLSIYISSQRSNTQSTDLPEWLENFLFQLNNIDLQNVKISELYKLSGYSQSRFSVLFNQYMEMPLVQYVNNLKLQYACSLLSQTDDKVIYICDLAGFSSIAHFNTLFKEKYGLSPTEYRKKFSTSNHKMSSKILDK